MTDSSPVTHERRLSVRRVPKGATRVEAQHGTMGPDANVAVRLLDLSTDGARFVASQSLPVGEEIQIQLNGEGSGATLERLAHVKWCSSDGEGKHHVGAQFEKPLTHADMLVHARLR